MAQNPPINQDKNKKTIRTKKTIPGVLLRIFLVLLVGVVVGSVVYFSAVGWVPYLEQSVFEPIDKNQTQLQHIASTQAALESQLTELALRRTEIPASNIEEFADSLMAAKEEIDEVKSDLRILTAYGLTQVPALLETITADQQASEAHISALATAQMADQRYQFETELIRIIAHLSRANQYFLHDNFGLAEDQLLAAGEILGELEGSLDSRQRPQAVELIDLIIGAIEDLPDQPDTAGLKLDLAWQLALQLLETLPDQSEPGPLTPTPEVTPTPTQEP